MTQLNGDNPAKPQVNPMALTVEMAAKVLGLPLEIIQKHIDGGAPAAADGTINLINYAAWLNARIINAGVKVRRGKGGGKVRHF